MASVSFALLTSAVTSSQLAVQGSVQESFRGAYDILVRPPNEVTTLEKQRGLVTSNFLSGTFGGITDAQYQSVLGVSGIEAAAPLANIGYVMPYVIFTLPVPVQEQGDAQLFRVRKTWVADAGLTQIDGGTDYVYISKSHQMLRDQDGVVAEVVPGSPEPVQVCRAFNEQSQAAEVNPSHFTRPSLLNCLSTRSGANASDERYEGNYGALFAGRVPALLAAIDPVQEARLLHLDAAVVSGRYLSDHEDISIESLPAGESLRGKMLPVLASTQTFVDTNLQIDVEQLQADENLRPLLTSANAYSQLTQRNGTKVDHYTVSAHQVYERLLERFGQVASLGGAVEAYWRPGPVRYRDGAAEPLHAEIVPPDPTAWFLPAAPGFLAPAGNADVGVRDLQVLAGKPVAEGGVYQLPIPHIVGRFDPDRLPGFNALSEVPLASYYAPAVRAADARSKAALGSEQLRPTMNLTGYVAQPPLMLTSLEAAQSLLAPDAYPEAKREAYISSIRVRVAQVTGPDEVSRERIRRVAASIADKTGLRVDITAGSSPTVVTAELPAGRFGRPALTVEEDWSQLGVAVRVLTAVDRKSVMLFVLVLVVCMFFVANAATAAARTRRAEIATLMALGWGRHRVFMSIVWELAVVGAVAGLAGVVVAAALVYSLSLHLSFWAVAVIPPIALALTVLAGLWSAYLASRLTPVDAFRDPVRSVHKSRPTRSLYALAWANTLRQPGRTVVGSLGLAMAVAALVVLSAITFAFQGMLGGTLLGEAVVVQTRAADYFSVGMAVALGGLSVADVVYLNVQDRATEMMTLRSSGWSQRHLLTATLLEGLWLGSLGAVTGATLGMVIAAAISGGLTIAVVTVAAACLAGGVAVAVLASAVALRSLPRTISVRVLMEDS